MQNGIGPANRRLVELDGIRGFALLIVLTTHFGVYGQETVGWFGKAFHGLVDIGWISVDVFFVLSGFLITGILLESKGSESYFKTFYLRRALRILPLYYCAVVVYFLVLVPALSVLSPDRASVAIAVDRPPSEQLWYYLHLANWRIAWGVTFKGIDHFWSLAIEEQFYLVWPVVIYFASRRTLWRVCIGIMAVSFTLRNLPAVYTLQETYPGLAYSLTPLRIEPMALGALLVLLVQNDRFLRHWRAWALGAFATGLLCLAAVIARTGSAGFEPVLMSRFGFSGAGLIGGSLVVYAALQSGSTSMGAVFLRNPFLVELGRLSYGMYVIHRGLSILSPPIQAALMPRIGGVAAQIVLIVTGTAVSYLLARISWALIEEPFLRLKARFSYSTSRVEKPRPVFDARDHQPSLTPTSALR
jgi:peptidoglycan/LPS O-acetylase OafA/YrhL